MYYELVVQRAWRDAILIGVEQAGPINSLYLPQKFPKNYIYSVGLTTVFKVVMIICYRNLPLLLGGSVFRNLP